MFLIFKLKTLHVYIFKFIYKQKTIFINVPLVERPLVERHVFTIHLYLVVSHLLNVKEHGCVRA